MTPGPADHLIVALLAVAVPALGALQFRRMTATLAEGKAGVRARQYRSTIMLQLATGTAVVAIWAGAGRALDGLVGLGIAPAGRWASAGWAAALLACAVLAYQAVVLRANPIGLSKVREQLGTVEGLLPRTSGELRLFVGLSLTAGICEELVYRGYLMAYLLPMAGAATAILGSTVLFGLAHAYQGGSGAIRTGVVGLVLAGIYAMTGNLLAPMLLHIVIDVTGGLVAYWAFGSEAGC